MAQFFPPRALGVGSIITQYCIGKGEPANTSDPPGCYSIDKQRAVTNWDKPS